jgi:hypothetical protein
MYLVNKVMKAFDIDKLNLREGEKNKILQIEAAN